MSPLPYPLRIAAGLVVTAVEQARELPRHAVELPVTAVSQALQVSMRVQQKVTELAIKGDRALSSLRPADDVPSWATFDDDLPEPPEPPSARNGAGVGVGVGVGDAISNGVSTVSSLRPTVTGIPVERPAGTPSAVPEYPSMTIPQLRGKLRTLTIDDLSDLLTWETSHGNRPAYVTMLTNRIATLTEQ